MENMGKYVLSYMQLDVKKAIENNLIDQKDDEDNFVKY